MVEKQLSRKPSLCPRGVPCLLNIDNPLFLQRIYLIIRARAGEANISVDQIDGDSWYFRCQTSRLLQQLSCLNIDPADDLIAKIPDRDFWDTVQKHKMAGCDPTLPIRHGLGPEYAVEKGEWSRREWIGDRSDPPPPQKRKRDNGDQGKSCSPKRKRDYNNQIEPCPEKTRVLSPRSTASQRTNTGSPHSVASQKSKPRSLSPRTSQNTNPKSVRSKISPMANAGDPENSPLATNADMKQPELKRSSRITMNPELENERKVVEKSARAGSLEPKSISKPRVAISELEKYVRRTGGRQCDREAFVAISKPPSTGSSTVIDDGGSLTAPVELNEPLSINLQPPGGSFGPLVGLFDHFFNATDPICESTRG